jgi:hypothetical protein
LEVLEPDENRNKQKLWLDTLTIAKCVRHVSVYSESLLRCQTHSLCPFDLCNAESTRIWECRLYLDDDFRSLRSLSLISLRDTAHLLDFLEKHRWHSLYRIRRFHLHPLRQAALRSVHYHHSIYAMLKAREFESADFTWTTIFGA